MDNIDRQLKELYDDLDKQDKEQKELLTNIENLVDSYGIPKTRGNKVLSLYERIDIALRKRAYA